MLVADLADADGRKFLEDVASRGGECWVPLVDAPADATTQLLEVYAPGAAEPLRLVAEPLGAPTERGFPLRLTPFAEKRIPFRQPFDTHESPTEPRTGAGKARRTNPSMLSKGTAPSSIGSRRARPHVA